MTDEIEKIGSDSLHRMQKMSTLIGSQQHSIEQVESSDSFIDEVVVSSSEFSPLAIAKQFPFQSIADRIQRKKSESASKTEDNQEFIIEDPEKIEAIAKHYEQQNEELNYRSLLMIRAFFKNNATMQDILHKITEFYPDQYLADETLDFLLATTSKGSDLEKTLLATKKNFNTTYEREIKSGKNIRNEAKLFAQGGLANAPTLRDLYRDITGNPRSPLTLFDELLAMFSYDKMEKALHFLLHALGSDLKSKGPSIDAAELKRLIEETRSLQSILWIYRFFLYRMQSIHAKFHKYNYSIPPHLNFITLSKALVILLQERYPSPDKILMLARNLGAIEQVAAQIIILTQYRDAMRQISPRLFRSEKHRQDLLLAILDTLHDLDEREAEQEEENS